MQRASVSVMASGCRISLFVVGLRDPVYQIHPLLGVREDLFQDGGVAIDFVLHRLAVGKTRETRQVRGVLDVCVCGLTSDTRDPRCSS